MRHVAPRGDGGFQMRPRLLDPVQPTEEEPLDRDRLRHVGRRGDNGTARCFRLRQPSAVGHRLDFVQPAQQAEQLVARDRVKLRGRLVESEQPRVAGECCAERDALELAARERVRAAVEQRADAERERRLLHPSRGRDRVEAAVLEREGQLGARRAHQHLGLGVLEQRADVRGELGRAVVLEIKATDLGVAGERAAVEVRDDPAGEAEQRALAGCGEPGDDHELAFLDRQADAVERGGRRARVAVGQLVQLEDTHRSIPRRWPKGAAASTTKARLTASVRALASEPWKVG